jgi:dephospho-CoA kinase
VKPLVLGLTGSIGMGKSTTASMFADLGIPVWDADEAVHRIYGAGGPAGGPISTLTGGVVTKDGAVDRAALRVAIAQDPGLLKRIETIVHPLVAADRAAFLEANGDAEIVVLDIPLLFETGGAAAMDRVAVVSTDAETQRGRVLERPGMDEATFERLLSRQVPDAEKRARADFVIPTDDLDTARAAVKELVERLRAERMRDA